MFYLEIVQCSGDGESFACYLYDSFEAVKDTLCNEAWARYVITEIGS